MIQYKVYSVYHNSHNASVTRGLPVPVLLNVLNRTKYMLNIHSCSME